CASIRPPPPPAPSFPPLDPAPRHLFPEEEEVGGGEEEVGQRKGGGHKEGSGPRTQDASLPRAWAGPQKLPEASLPSSSPIRAGRGTSRRRIRPTPLSTLASSSSSSSTSSSSFPSNSIPQPYAAALVRGRGDGDLTREPSAPPLSRPPPRTARLLPPPPSPSINSFSSPPIAPRHDTLSADKFPAPAASSSPFLTPVKAPDPVPPSHLLPPPPPPPPPPPSSSSSSSSSSLPSTLTFSLPPSCSLPGSAAGTSPSLPLALPPSLPPPSSSRLLLVASVYASLLSLRLAPSLTTELHLLFRLLTVHPALLLRPPALPPSLPPFLTSGHACNLLAAHTLALLPHLLSSLPPSLLSLLLHVPALHDHVPHALPSLTRLPHSSHRPGPTSLALLPHHRDADGKGRRWGGEVALPFVEEKDGRQLYAGSGWGQEVFNRQETARDLFLNLFREWEEVRTRELDLRAVERWVGKEMPRRAREVLTGLDTWSLGWFAGVWVALLVKVGAGGEGREGGGGGREEEVLARALGAKGGREGGGGEGGQPRGGGRGGSAATSASCSPSEVQRTVLPSSLKLHLLHRRLTAPSDTSFASFGREISHRSLPLPPSSSPSPAPRRPSPRPSLPPALPSPRPLLSGAPTSFSTIS
ncbi:hypothetical protein Naga_101674g1, partial [Nannochloropsis gaditana]